MRMQCRSWLIFVCGSAAAQGGKPSAFRDHLCLILRLSLSAEAQPPDIAGRRKGKAFLLCAAAKPRPGPSNQNPASVGSLLQ